MNRFWLTFSELFDISSKKKTCIAYSDCSSVFFYSNKRQISVGLCELRDFLYWNYECVIDNRIKSRCSWGGGERGVIVHWYTKKIKSCWANCLDCLLSKMLCFSSNLYGIWVKIKFDEKQSILTINSPNSLLNIILFILYSNARSPPSPTTSWTTWFNYIINHIFIVSV